MFILLFVQFCDFCRTIQSHARRMKTTIIHKLTVVLRDRASCLYNRIKVGVCLSAFVVYQPSLTISSERTMENRAPLT